MNTYLLPHATLTTYKLCRRSVCASALELLCEPAVHQGAAAVSLHLLPFLLVLQPSPLHLEPAKTVMTSNLAKESTLLGKCQKPWLAACTKLEELINDGHENDRVAALANVNASLITGLAAALQGLKPQTCFVLVSYTNFVNTSSCRIIHSEIALFTLFFCKRCKEK